MSDLLKDVPKRKRLFDLALTIPGLLIISPILLLLATYIRVRLGTPVLFRQLRPGLHGKPFLLYKFSTMTSEVNNQGEPLPDTQRLTSFGQFLRSFSLDELPELINVLKGEMSLVGPRPLLMQYLERYTQGHRLRTPPNEVAQPGPSVM